MLFNFIRKEQLSVGKSCGLSAEKCEELLEVAENVMNESLDLAIQEETTIQGMSGIRIEARVSPYEMAQALAEKVEELTPEVSLFIGMVIDYELRNERRHVEYYSSKLK